MFTEEKAFGEAPVKTPDLKEAWRVRVWEAAQLIRQGGFCQQNFVNINGERCVLGAIYKAVPIAHNGHFHGVSLGEAMFSADATNAFLAYMQDRFPGFNSIPEWNDHPSRTKEEVVAALEDCALNYAPKYAI